MSPMILKSMMKSAMRDKISLFYAAVFPVILMIGLGLYIKGAAYHRTLLVGSLALGTVFWAVQGVAFQVLQQRNRGVYKLLQTTPVKVSVFVLNMTLSRTILGLFVNLFVLVVGLVFFHISISPISFVALVLTLIVGSLAFSCLGFLVVNLALNEAQINMMSNLLYLPMVFGSQAFYSLNGVPQWLVFLGKCFPFQYFVHALRGILDGVGTGVATDVCVLAAFAVGLLILSTLTFRYDNEGFRLVRKNTFGI